ncbi:hypothetical protein HPB51_020106 [Rhipicephalus microplus]|uniref:Uncharacterized protein n=1 Tax=Rhipicephalus microplus TaxID=6941 RepID=A0A9J6EI04_RHIMP|nr:hypothetical protein HPB51_020106 [Rhipicephalus microplus]
MERARVELAAEEEAVEAAQLASVSQRAGRRSRSGSRSKSGRRSLYRSPVSRNRSASIGGGGSAAGRQITWADKVKGGPITGRTCEQSQEHVGCNRDKDRITQSEKENHSLKTSIGGLLKTVAELKRSLQTGNSTSEGRKPDSPAEVPRSVDVPKENVADEETPARKKRVLSIARAQAKVGSEPKKKMATLQKSMNQIIIRLERIEERENITDQRLGKIEVHLNETLLAAMER